MTQKAKLPDNIILPHHVVIIPDGNRRWARAQNKPTLLGHKKGFDVAHDVILAGHELGIHTITVWAFSTGNWDRTPKEINYLMSLYSKMIDQHLKRALKDKVRIIHLGRKDRIPKSLAEKIASAEDQTRKFTKHVLNIALDHGGHDDLVRNLNLNRPAYPLTEDVIAGLLDTHDQPYPNPDLIIRTSGEHRTSGILNFQSDQTELYFLSEHFPAFSPEKLTQAVLDYSRRRRRFGGNDKNNHLKFNPDSASKIHSRLLAQPNRSNLAALIKSVFNLKLPTTADNLQSLTSIKAHTDFAFDPAYVNRLYQAIISDATIFTQLDYTQAESQLTTFIAELFRINSFQAHPIAVEFNLAHRAHHSGQPEQTQSHLKSAYTLLASMVA